MWRGSLRRRGIPAVPVFWLATEDHDFAEVNHAWVFGAAVANLQCCASMRPRNSPASRARSAASRSRSLRRRIPRRARRAAVHRRSDGGRRPSLPSRRDHGRGIPRAAANRCWPSWTCCISDPLDPAMRKIGAPFLAQALAPCRSSKPDSDRAQQSTYGRRLPRASARGRRRPRCFSCSKTASARRCAARIPITRNSPIARRTSVAQRPAAAGVAGLSAADGRLRWRPGRARVPGAVAGGCIDVLLGRMPVAMSRSGFTHSGRTLAEIAGALSA